AVMKRFCQCDRISINHRILISKMRTVFCLRSSDDGEAGARRAPTWCQGNATIPKFRQPLQYPVYRIHTCPKSQPFGNLLRGLPVLLTPEVGYQPFLEANRVPSSMLIDSWLVIGVDIDQFSIQTNGPFEEGNECTE